MPDLEAGVAGAEVEFLLIARAVGDVALAVDAHDLARVVDHRQRCCNNAARRASKKLVGMWTLSSLASFCIALTLGMFAQRRGGGEGIEFLHLAEIRPFEEFGRQDQFRALRRGIADMAFDDRVIRPISPPSGHWIAAT